MRANTLLIRHSDGYSWVADATAVDADGVLEGFGKYPQDTSAEAARKAAAALNNLASARWSTTLRIEPTGTGDVPFTDFNVGDTMTVPNEAGTAMERRVIGLTIAQPGDEIVYEPAIGDYLPGHTERNTATAQTLTTGTAGGRLNDANPTIPPSKLLDIEPDNRETIVFEDLDGPVVVSSSIECPVRVGGYASVVANVETAPTTAVTLAVYRNSVEIGTFDIPVSSTQAVAAFQTLFSPLDRVSVAVTIKGVAATGLCVSVWF